MGFDGVLLEEGGGERVLEGIRSGAQKYSNKIRPAALLME